MGSRFLMIIIVVLGALLLVSASTFTVSEQEQALRVQFKSVIGKDYKPGLHFKYPFIDDVFKFDRRVITKKYSAESFLTSDSQGLSVDYYIKWRIVEPEKFYQATSGGDEQRAEGLIIGPKIQDGIKTAVARRTLREMVISDRQQVTSEFMSQIGETIVASGIELVDVRVQRIDLREDVAARVYESMKQHFEGITRTLRGEGDRGAQIIRAEVERKRTELIAKANADAQRIRGEGDATAAALYAAAYNRNPEFYSFYRSLQAYRTSLGKEGDVLVVSPDSEFFRYLKSPAPQRR
jgi:modulator of FtsH protease HflC